VPSPVAPLAIQDLFQKSSVESREEEKFVK
jgi:hypothetical protein